MKKVLITGKNSYLGSFVKQELNRYPQKYQVQELDMMDPKRFLLSGEYRTGLSNGL